MKDRYVVKDLIMRAKKLIAQRLCLLDLHIQGQRHRDIKNGLTILPKITLSSAFNTILKTSLLGNLVEYMGSSNISTPSKWIANQFDTSLNWDDVAWIKELWDGPLIIEILWIMKMRNWQIEVGADAIVVSNHGGRQLDSFASSVSQLPKIVNALNTSNNTQILFDSGITTGADILKAKAMEADGTFIGKAFLYGLGAFGK